MSARRWGDELRVMHGIGRAEGRDEGHGLAGMKDKQVLWVCDTRLHQFAFNRRCPGPLQNQDLQGRSLGISIEPSPVQDSDGKPDLWTDPQVPERMQGGVTG